MAIDKSPEEILEITGEKILEVLGRPARRQALRISSRRDASGSIE
jgi:hypothetical protein